MTPLRRAILFFASGFGAGYSPIASGTVASAVAIPIYLLVLDQLNRPGWPLAIYLAIVAALFAAGVWASTEAERVLKEKDPHFVTIDEIVGFFASLILVPISWKTLAAAFFLFRLFDVWKPWPIRRSQSLPGGLGIMIDDLLAGAYACVVLQVTVYFLR
ncbi:MAG: phosphatidylglycerophosphatase A [Candidatus Sumerlaeota bacterium]|nr:phosphatidylglycerophosphatase A [Candidatus Sumerlaeota bacterium]